MNPLHQSTESEAQAPAKPTPTKEEGLASWQRETLLRIDQCLDKLRRYREAVRPLNLEDEKEQ